MARPLLERRWPWLAAAGAIVAVFLATSIQLPGTTDPRPLGSADDIARLRERTDVNVLFVLVDMLRADRLGCYGYERDTSPVIDRLANTGVRFAHHLAQSSWTKASMASLWTALNPVRTGITRYNHVLPEAAEMPAELLAKAGFETVGFYRNGWVAPTFGFGQGYEIYKRPTSRPLSPDVKQANPTLTDRSTDEGTIESAAEFLRFSNRRWFLYLHLMDVHEYLYDRQSALFGSSHSDIYDNSIRHTDSLLGDLIGTLAEAGQLDRTVIVVAADHGEAFGERGFDGHAREVFRETTETPLVISFPFRLEPSLTLSARTRNVDVWPTILDLVGLAYPHPVDGKSRVPEIVALARGEEPSGDGKLTAIAHLDQTWGRPDLQPNSTVAVVDGDFRYVRIEGETGPAETLLDRRGDPEELRNRAAEDPETLDRLRKEADRYLEGRPSWGDTPTRELDELELNHLRALGYALP